MIRSNVRERSELRYSYATAYDDKENTVPNLHRRYFQEYDKHSPPSDPMLEELSCSVRPEDVSAGDREEELLAKLNRLKLQDRLTQRVRQLQSDNAKIKSQLAQKLQLIEQMTSTMKEKDADRQKLEETLLRAEKTSQIVEQQLKDQISIVLLKNEELQKELALLKVRIKEMNQNQLQAKLSQQRHYTYEPRSKSLSRTYQSIPVAQPPANASIQQQQDNSKEKVLVERAREMYGQIVGEECSLKELWRWLKSLGRMHFKMKMWRNKVRELLRRQLQVSPITMTALLHEAVHLLT